MLEWKKRETNIAFGVHLWSFNPSSELPALTLIRQDSLNSTLQNYCDNSKYSTHKAPSTVPGA